MVEGRRQGGGARRPAAKAVWKDARDGPTFRIRHGARERRSRQSRGDWAAPAPPFTDRLKRRHGAFGCVGDRASVMPGLDLRPPPNGSPRRAAHGAGATGSAAVAPPSVPHVIPGAAPARPRSRRPGAGCPAPRRGGFRIGGHRARGDQDVEQGRAVGAGDGRARSSSCSTRSACMPKAAPSWRGRPTGAACRPPCRGRRRCAEAHAGEREAVGRDAAVGTCCGRAGAACPSGARRAEGPWEPPPAGYPPGRR